MYTMIIIIELSLSRQPPTLLKSQKYSFKLNHFEAITPFFKLFCSTDEMCAAPFAHLHTCRDFAPSYHPPLFTNPDYGPEDTVKMFT